MINIDKMRDYYKAGNTRSIEKRLQYLRLLKAEIKSREDEIYAALRQDFCKCEFETYATEIMLCYNEIDFMLKQAEKLLKADKVRTSIINFPAKGRIEKTPYGVVAIVSPWNYPFMLTIVPLIGAIACGNVCLLKPSDYSRNTSELIESIIGNVFPPEYVSVVLGGRETNQKLFELHFDLMFFTGSPTVGKIVMEKAAAHLTPVVLELGGKSPAIVHKDANLRVSARRIAWGKFVNCGQTCVAVDHVYVHEDIAEEFIKETEKVIKEFYYQDNELSADYAHIINEKHFQRLLKLLDESKIVFGGNYDESSLLLEPIIMKDVSYDDAVMQEEIFGPIMPILTYKDIDVVIEEINDHPKPLALYLFSSDEQIIEKVQNYTDSGAMGINEVVMHVAEDKLPFGGVGNSGMGRYHGKESIRTFTYQRSVLIKSPQVDIPLKYPPYKNLNLLKKLAKK